MSTRSYRYLLARTVDYRRILKLGLILRIVSIFAVFFSSLTACLLGRPSLELCKTLVMLRDVNISGKICLGDIPVIMHMLQFWRVSFRIIPT